MHSNKMIPVDLMAKGLNKYTNQLLEVPPVVIFLQQFGDFVINRWFWQRYFCTAIVSDYSIL